MSLSDELLASLSDESAVHIHSVSDSDAHFVIDPNTRQITSMSPTPNVLMQNDHRSEIYTFEIPRHVEGHDMLKCNRIRLHFINVGSGNQEYRDSAELSLRANPADATTLISTWEIRRQVIQYAGKLCFLLQYLCIEGGDIVYEWHTDIYSDVEIRATFDNGEPAVFEYSNILEDWYQKLFGAGDSVAADAIARIEAKAEEALASIPEDYTTTHNMAKEALRKKANAIILETEGESIVVDDSSDSYLLGLKVFGKTTQIQTTGAQLLDIPDAASKTDRGLTQIISGGACVVKGTASSNAAFNLTLIGAYGGTDILFTLEAGTYTATDCIISSYDGTTRTNHTGVFTLTEAFNVTWVSTRSYGATEAVNETTYPMLNAGNTAIAWERYSGGAASPNPNYPWAMESIGADKLVGVAVHGKNLLQPRPVSNGGYTAVVNDDGSVTVTGAATTTSSIYLTIATPATDNPLYLLKGVPYFMWGNSTNGKDIGTKTVDRYGNSLWGSPSAWNKNFGPDYDRLVQIYIESTRHEIGDTSLCGTYRFQLEVGTEFTGFEAYKGPQSLGAAYVLHGIPVDSGGNCTDTSGQQWLCDEVDFERGVYVQRVAIHEFDGSDDEYWQFAERTAVNDGVVYVNKGLISPRNAYCSHYKFSFNAVSAKKEYRGFFDIHYGQFRVNSYGYDSADAFREFLKLNPITLMCPITAPIETPLTDVELANFKMVSTHYHSTTILNNAGAHMAIRYNADMKTYVDRSIKSSVTDVLEAIENGSY